MLGKVKEEFDATNDLVFKDDDLTQGDVTLASRAEEPARTTRASTSIQTTPASRVTKSKKASLHIVEEEEEEEEADSRETSEEEEEEDIEGLLDDPIGDDVPLDEENEEESLQVFCV